MSGLGTGGGVHEGKPKETGWLTQEKGVRLPHQLSDRLAPGQESRARWNVNFFAGWMLDMFTFRASKPISNHQNPKMDWEPSNRMQTYVFTNQICKTKTLV